jgi:hypothetical protein
LLNTYQPNLSDIIATSGKPNFILEADLFSPCQSSGNPIQSKDVYWNATQESIWRFIEQEKAGDYVVAWLLTERPHFGNACGSEPTEITWHEAYRDNGVERPWFQPWWIRTNLP